MPFIKGKLAFRETFGEGVAVDLIRDVPDALVSDRIANLTEGDAEELARFLCGHFEFGVYLMQSVETEVVRRVR